MNSGPNFNIGGDLNAQNLVTGNMIGSANAAVQQMNRTHESAHQLLSEVLVMLQQSRIEDGKLEVAQAVKKLADNPSTDNKDGLINMLKSYGEKAAALGTSLSSLDKLVESVKQLAV